MERMWGDEHVMPRVQIRDDARMERMAAASDSNESEWRRTRQP